ncbi:helix-turn-helix transcriptional regulator [Natrialbaceae archaeon A-gly3]
MVFDTLMTRLSSLWRSDSSDEGTPEGEADTATVGDRATADDETLSYADQVEYGVDEHDLTDEDRILRLLVKRGGRVDKSTILEETGWDREHLEEVIAGMEDDDQVSSITVGRKQVVCRRGFEPKGYRSHLGE